MVSECDIVGRSGDDGGSSLRCPQANDLPISKQQVAGPNSIQSRLSSDRLTLTLAKIVLTRLQRSRERANHGLA